MCIGLDYENKKKKALRDYERYLGIRADQDDHVDLSRLERFVADLKEDRFSLVVAGEVKSGKSTFINALIGEYLLPTDVLQSTCTVVEITKSEDLYLRVTYAKMENGSRKESTYRGEEALGQLRKVAAVPEEYRHIPFTLIASYLADGNPVPSVDELERMSGISMKGKEGLVRQYVEEFKDGSRIPIVVKLGYPLKDAITDICIVDTPGVNAVGSIQDKTLAYINTANAILFVHPIKPVEAESFRTFLKEKATVMSRDALFLILSHAGQHPRQDVEKLIKDAKRIHPEIDPLRIIAVDSLLRLIEMDLKTKSVEQVMEDEARRKVLGSYYFEAKGKDKDALLQIIRSASNFEAVGDMIEQLNKGAPNLTIREIYQRLRTGYRNQQESIDNEIKLKEKRRRSPQDFATRISNIREEIEAYKVRANELAEKLKEKYLSVHGDFARIGEQMWRDFSGRIDLSSNDGEVRKHLLDFIQASGKQTLESVVARLIEDCDQEMRKIGGEFKKQTDFVMPRVDIDSLMQRARDNAYDTHKVKVSDGRSDAQVGGGLLGAVVGGILGFLFGGPAGAVVGAGLAGGGGALAGRAVGRDPVYEYRTSFNQEKYLSNCKQGAKVQIKTALDSEIPELMRELINDFTGRFRHDVVLIVEKENEKITKIEEEQKSNEQLLTEVKALQSRHETLERQLQEVDTIIPNLR